MTTEEQQGFPAQIETSPLPDVRPYTFDHPTMFSNVRVHRRDEYCRLCQSLELLGNERPQRQPDVTGGAEA